MADGWLWCSARAHVHEQAGVIMEEHGGDGSSCLVDHLIIDSPSESGGSCVLSKCALVEKSWVAVRTKSTLSCSLHFFARIRHFLRGVAKGSPLWRA